MSRSPKKTGGKGQATKSRKGRKYGGVSVEESSDLGFESCDSSIMPTINGTGSLSRGNSTKSRSSDRDGMRSPIKSIVRKSYDHSVTLTYDEIIKDNLEDTYPDVTLELMKSMTAELSAASHDVSAILSDQTGGSSLHESFIQDIPPEGIVDSPMPPSHHEETLLAGNASISHSFQRNQSHSFRHRRDKNYVQSRRYKSLRSPLCSPNFGVQTTDFVDARDNVQPTLTQSSFSPNVQSTPKRSPHDESGNISAETPISHSQQPAMHSPIKDSNSLTTSTLGDLPTAFDSPSRKSRPSVVALRAQLELKFASNSSINSRCSDANIHLVGQSKTSSVRDIIKRFESGTITNQSPEGSPVRNKSTTLPGRAIMSMYNPTQMELSMIRSETVNSHMTGSEPSLVTEDRFTINNGPSEPLPTEPKYVHISCSASGYSSVLYRSPSAQPGGEPGDESEMGGKNSTSKQRNLANMADSAANMADTAASASDSKVTGIENSSNKEAVDATNVTLDFQENKENILVNGNHLKDTSQVNGKDCVIDKLYDAEITATNTASKESCPLNDSYSTKDGNYFLKLVESQERHLVSCCHHVEEHMSSETLPEDASGFIRAAVGKANLLMSQKFEQFRSLCHNNLNQSDDEPFKTTSQDLAGFWDMVELQVEDVQGEFDTIEKMKSNNWQEPEPVVRVRRNSSSSSQKGASTEVNKTHSKITANTGARTKTTKTKEGAKNPAKAREEARKRLMAAKRAMRHRISSGEEVEIFLPESAH